MKKSPLELAARNVLPLRQRRHKFEILERFSANEVEGTKRVSIILSKGKSLLLMKRKNLGNQFIFYGGTQLIFKFVNNIPDLS